MRLKALLIGITLVVSVSVGPYIISISHRIGGETRIAHALSFGRVQKGTSVCIAGCSSTAKIKNFEKVNLSPAEPVALSMTRSEGNIAANIGLSKSIGIPSGNVKVRFAATESFDGADAVRVIHSPLLKPLVPTSVDDYVRDYQRANKVSLGRATGMSNFPVLPARKPPASIYGVSDKFKLEKLVR